MSNYRVGYVNISVSNLDRSVEFFQQTVGLPLKFADSDFGYASFDTPGAGLGLAQTDDAAQLGRHTGIGFTVEDLDAEHAALTDKGVEFTRPPTKEPWGGYMAIFADPDGNTFYLDQIDPNHG